MFLSKCASKQGENMVLHEHMFNTVEQDKEKSMMKTKMVTPKSWSLASDFVLMLMLCFFFGDHGFRKNLGFV